MSAPVFSPGRLRKIRQDAGFKVEHVALMLGKSSYTVVGWETGRAKPNATSLGLLAGMFGITVSDLFEIPAEGAAAAPAPARSRVQDNAGAAA